MSNVKIKMKFCESLDRFVEIREFTEEEIEKLFKNVKITDKKAYKRLVINATIVNYNDEIAPLIFDNNYSLFGEIAEQELYNLCIKVNPNLDIKKVTINMNEDGKVLPSLNELGEEIEDDSSVLDDEKIERLIHMEEHLKKKIIGQDTAVTLVSQAIRKAFVGLKNPNKPIGVFIFAGQTGVGKTALAKAVAEFLFGNENELVRIDCSEYSQPHEYSKLIGAPPGYIGHKEGGVLTDAIKNKPNSVVLFDEIEKADEKVHNLLLQIMDDGILTDNKGNKISFKETVVIMTSNVGVDDFKKIETSIGFGQEYKDLSHKVKDDSTNKALKKAFKPEFLNRVDEIVTFNALGLEEYVKIINIMLSEVIERLETNWKMKIDIPKDVQEFLANKGNDPKYGARPLRRAIKTYVENVLSEMILHKEFVRADHILSRLNENKDSIIFVKKDLEEDKKSSSKKSKEKEESKENINKNNKTTKKKKTTKKESKTKK
jgi:ATP-dependent Clp protease ATP-binding subunit ClpC